MKGSPTVDNVGLSVQPAPGGSSHVVRRIGPVALEARCARSRRGRANGRPLSHRSVGGERSGLPGRHLLHREAKLSGDHSIEIWSDGTRTRSFQHIDDCIHAILASMDSDIRQPINLGSSEVIKQLLGWQPSIPLNAGVQQRCRAGSGVSHVPATRYLRPRPR
jgi:hypothetical protein